MKRAKDAEDDDALVAKLSRMRDCLYDAVCEGDNGAKKKRGEHGSLCMVNTFHWVCNYGRTRMSPTQWRQMASVLLVPACDRWCSCVGGPPVGTHADLKSDLTWVFLHLSLHPVGYPGQGFDTNVFLALG